MFPLAGVTPTMSLAGSAPPSPREEERDQAILARQAWAATQDHQVGLAWAGLEYHPQITAYVLDF